MVRQTVENLRYLCNSQVSRLIVHRVLNVSEMLRWGGEGTGRVRGRVTRVDSVLANKSSARTMYR